jgi:hypothetical protein
MSNVQVNRRKVAITIAEVFFLGVLIALALTIFYSIGEASADAGSGSGAAIGAAGSGASAPTLPDPDKDPGSYLEQAFNAARSGDWTAVTALFLIGIVWLARKPWALGKIKFFSTDRGGVVLAFGLSVLGGLATAITAMGKFPTDIATYKMIAMTAVTAMGGYVALKRLIWPPDKKTDPATP